MEKNHLKSLLKKIAKDLCVSVADLVDFELSLVDAQKSNLMGIHDEFVSSERLDNMFCTSNALNAMVKYYIDNKDNLKGVSMLGCYDHEEVGSRSV